MSVLGTGVVGAGIMGRRMMAALQGHPRWGVAAAWDPHADAVPDGVPRASSLKSLLHDTAIDAVYIASPPAAHLPGVLDALAARHPVLCEEPLTPDVASAQALPNRSTDRSARSCMREVRPSASRFRGWPRR